MNLPNTLTVARIFLGPLLVVVLLTKFEVELIFGVPKEVVGAAIFGLAAFTDWLDGYHFAVALALRQDLSPSNDDLTFTARNWNVGSVDATLTSIVQVLRPESEGQPFRYMRRLAESGLDEIRKRKATGQLRWEDLLVSPVNDVES